jgi:hypothetical protein
VLLPARQGADVRSPPQTPAGDRVDLTERTWTAPSDMRCDGFGRSPLSDVDLSARLAEIAATTGLSPFVQSLRGPLYG